MPTAADSAAYKDALKLLIAKLRRDLERPDMNIVIGRIKRYALRSTVMRGCAEMHNAKLPMKIPGAPGFDVDDLNDREKSMGRS